MRRKRIEKASREAFRSARHSSIGLELGVSVIIGCLLGLWVDEKLGSKPWGFFGGLLLGLVAAVRSITRTLKLLNQEDQEDQAAAQSGTAQEGEDVATPPENQGDDALDTGVEDGGKTDG